MWWVAGGILIAATVVRWVSGRNRAESTLDRADQVERVYTMLRRGRPVAIAAAPDGPVVFKGKVSASGAAPQWPGYGRPTGS